MSERLSRAGKLLIFKFRRPLFNIPHGNCIPLWNSEIKRLSFNPQIISAHSGYRDRDYEYPALATKQR